MKKIVALIPVLCIFLISCKKNGKTSHCYECDFSPLSYPGSSPGIYQDAGCMTEDQWKTVEFTDAAGNLKLDKGAKCRYK